MNNSIYRNEIEYLGIDNYIPNDIRSFKSTDISKLCEINTLSPDVNRVLKVKVDSKIIDYRFIDTIAGSSIDGQKTTGKKAILNGRITFRIEYTSIDQEDCIYVIYDKKDFNAVISLSPNTQKSQRLIPSIFIEDVYTRKIDKRNVFFYATLIVMVELD